MRSNLTYLAGKIEMASYLQRAFDEGQDIAEVFSSLRSAKINPNNPEHTKLLKEVQNLSKAAAI